MNGRPGQYKIANPNTLVSASYSTDYTSEFFEVYTPAIRTRYSEVFWRLVDLVPLPPHIVQRFRNKTMAIIGYEADQVRRTEAGDVPVPVTWAYNHHYMAWLLNNHTEMVKVKATPEAMKNGHSHGASEYWTVAPKGTAPPSSEDIAVSQFFSEGNGGEWRMSYHGYPKGYAQLIDSPHAFSINPMQIDTKNRDHHGADFKPSLLPKTALSPPNASYSGLLECPCTPRLKKEWHLAHGTQNVGRCERPVQTASECFEAGPTLAKAVRYLNQTVSDKNLPSKCSIVVHANGTAVLSWNSAEDGAQCGASGPGPLHVSGSAQSLATLTVDLRQDTPAGSATLTLKGPSDVWFGVGLGATTMCLHPEADECPGGGPYTIIVNGDGAEGVMERKLDDHGPGAILQRSVTVVSNSVEAGIRTVVLTRPFQGLTDKHYTFNPRAPSIPFISAKGSSLTFGFHNGQDSQTLSLVAANAVTCLCQTGVHGSIGGVPFPDHVCAPEPKGDLLKQQNPTCSVQTYSGGLRCCKHGEFLLDPEQTPPEEVLEYHMKFRFYFEEYIPGPSPSHLNLVRLYWQTEAFAGEYDIVPCELGTPPQDCIQVITSRWKVKDMMRDCPLRENTYPCTGSGSADPNRTAGVKLIYAGPHCHAPDCLSMELYNADTGKLLCHMEPIFGKGDPADPYDEKGYVALPPCLWGDAAEGLLAPPMLTLETELLSIKRNNNSVGHYGEMASWQMRGILVPAGNVGAGNVNKRPSTRLIWEQSPQLDDDGLFV